MSEKQEEKIVQEQEKYFRKSFLNSSAMNCDVQAYIPVGLHSCDISENTAKHSN